MINECPHNSIISSQLRRQREQH